MTEDDQIKERWKVKGEGWRVNTCRVQRSNHFRYWEEEVMQFYVTQEWWRAGQAKPSGSRKTHFGGNEEKKREITKIGKIAKNPTISWSKEKQDCKSKHRKRNWILRWNESKLNGNGKANKLISNGNENKSLSGGNESKINCSWKWKYCQNENN